MVSKLFQYEKQQRGWYYQLSWLSAWIILVTTERSENSHVGVTDNTGVKVLLTDIPVSSTEAALPSYQTASSNPLGVYSLIKAMYVCAAPKGRGFAPFLSENGYKLCPFWLLRLERSIPYYTPHIRPQPGPDLPYQAPTYHIRPRVY